MNEELYQEIRKKLSEQKKVKDYELENEQIYRIKNGKRCKVLRRFELEPVMQIMHDHPISAHFSVKATYEKIKERYYWPNMRKDVEEFIKSCDNCQRRNKPKGKHELHSIRIKEPWYLIGIDIVGPLPITENGNRYIVTAMDYFTKWPEARALKEATAEKVMEFIFEDIICRHGSPKRILSDRGTHFNNQLIEEFTKTFKVKHGFSTPYHPKTNGLVERFNKTLCESLAKLSKENKNWDKNISAVLFAYRTKRHDTTEIEPFYLEYGRKARLPINDEEYEEKSIKERIIGLIEELPIIRNKAKMKSRINQGKREEYFNKKIKKEHNFEIGDKVLYYNAAKEKQWSGKLDEKWKGPYYIHRKLLKGSYEIKDLNGKIMKTPVNGELLKEYFDREGFIPYVVI
jgi:transposase InsO family protein